MDIQQNARPDVAVVLSEALPEELAAGLVADLAATGARAAMLRTPSGPFAGVELSLPTAAAVFLVSSYFAGMAKKAGEEHYEVVKGVARRLFRRVSTLRFTPVGTPGKMSPNSPFSLTYSIVGEVREELRFKLVIRSEMTVADSERGIDAFLDLIRALHTGDLDEAQLQALLPHRPVGGTALLTFDARTGRLLPVGMDGSVADAPGPGGAGA